jgi:hypothetical protein
MATMNMRILLRNRHARRASAVIMMTASNAWKYVLLGPSTSGKRIYPTGLSMRSDRIEDAMQTGIMRVSCRSFPNTSPNTEPAKIWAKINIRVRNITGMKGYSATW